MIRVCSRAIPCGERKGLLSSSGRGQMNWLNRLDCMKQFGDRFLSTHILKLIFLVFFTIVLLPHRSAAQTSSFGRSSAPVIGGTSGMPAPPKNSFSTNNGIFEPGHTTPGGRPCVGVLGFSKPQLVNQNIINHQVLISNACGQTIKVRVCYYQRSDCIVVMVKGYEKTEKNTRYCAGYKRLQIRVPGDFLIHCIS